MFVNWTWRTLCSTGIGNGPTKSQSAGRKVGSDMPNSLTTPLESPRKEMYDMGWGRRVVTITPSSADVLFTVACIRSVSRRANTGNIPSRAHGYTLANYLAALAFVVTPPESADGASWVEEARARWRSYLEAKARNQSNSRSLTSQKNLANRRASHEPEPVAADV